MKIEQIPTDKLIPYARNAKRHDAAQVSKLAGSIREFGFNNPVLIDKDNGIVAGHGRVMAAQKLELKTVPCIRLGHLTDTQRRAYILADNRLAEVNSGWDEELLKLEIKDIDWGELKEISIDDFEFGEIDFGEEKKEPESDADAEPQIDKAEELRAKWGVEPGQLWELGDHRLLCGDSTRSEDLERAIGGDRVDMVWTDPPYGIAYSSERWANLGPQSQGLSAKRNQAPMIVGDDKPFDPSFLLSAFPSAREMFVWGFQYYPEKLGRGGVIVWNKKTETQAECAHGDFELCWSREERNKMCWLTWGGFKSKESGEERLHTTQKPIALAVWFFNHWGKAEDVVIDCFSGSGTTLMACEQLGRKCRAIEISPGYVAVALQRWADATGKTPRKL
jgi:16S rRNA G966 N2-methylase RsmD